jgi:uncharacterized RDD family membrane protein YckC
MNPHKAMGRRIVALLIDGLILTAINSAMFFPFAVKETEIAERVESGELEPDANVYFNVALGDDQYSIVGGDAAIFGLATLLVAFLYWVVLVGRTGWSPGKAVLGLRVVRVEDGTTPPGMLRAFLRHFLWIADMFPYLIPGLAGFIAAMTNPKRRRIGDLAGSTMVVKKAAVASSGGGGGGGSAPAATFTGGGSPLDERPAPAREAAPPVMGTQAMPAITPASKPPEPPPLPAPASGPPADWYPDPHGQKRLRYWDGAAWTDHTAD